MEPFESWGRKATLAEGAFGSVYKISDMFISIQIGAQLFKSMVVKVAKVDGKTDLYGEAKKLGKLTRNTVRRRPGGSGTPRPASHSLIIIHRRHFDSLLHLGSGCRPCPTAGTGLMRLFPHSNILHA